MNICFKSLFNPLSFASLPTECIPWNGIHTCVRWHLGGTQFPSYFFLFKSLIFGNRIYHYFVGRIELKGIQELLCFSLGFSPKNFHYFFTSPWAATGCTETCQIDQPTGGVTVHSHFVWSFENLLQQYVGEGYIAVDKEKHNFS